MVGLVPTPADRADYAPDPLGTRTLSWSNTAGGTGLTSILTVQDVSDWQTLLIRNVNTGAPVNASLWSVRWWADPHATLTAGIDPLVIPAGLPFDVALPVKAPYVSIDAVSTTGAGTHPVGGYIAVSSYPARHFADLPQDLVNIRSITIGAGATLTSIAQVMRPGRATYTMECNVAAPWNTTIDVMDSGGVWQWEYRWLFTGMNGPAPAELLLPRSLVRVTVQNTDAAAHSFTGSLVSAGS